MKWTLIKLFLGISTVLFLASCRTESENSTAETADEDSIQVMTSFYPMYEFTNQVAGDRADVDVMVSSGEDAHGFEPSAQNVATVSEADVFVYSSDEMEFWVPSLLESFENEELVVARAADGRHPDQEDGSEEEEQHIDDPHIWLDLVYAQEQVDVIADALTEADPEGEDIYAQNAEEFKDQLQNLHEEYETELGDAENRTFVVQHEAFGHLANRYDLNQVAIGGLSTEVEPNPSQIAEIGEMVDEYNVPVIYYQHGADSSIAQTVAEETGTEIEVLHDLEVLSEELEEQDLGYIDAMKENLENLKLSIQ